MLFRLAGLAGIGLLAASPAVAQGRHPIIRQADSAFAAGDLRLADSLYYVVPRVRPRDPEGRAALGRYLGSQGRAKVAIVLLEEARLFGGDPAEIARTLVPYYSEIGDWRALLTLPSSPLTLTERRRAAWLSENPFAIRNEGGSAPIIGAPRGDTIARVPVRLGNRAAVASIVDGDVGFVVDSRLASGIHRFGDDSTLVAFDWITVGQAEFANVPATTEPAATSVVVGAAALGRLVLQVDYARHRVVMTRKDASRADAQYPLARFDGRLNVLDRGRWIGLGEFAASVARAGRTLVVDFPVGEVRIKR